jgi:hypothetical protein
MSARTPTLTHDRPKRRTTTIRAQSLDPQQSGKDCMTALSIVGLVILAIWVSSVVLKDK